MDSKYRDKMECPCYMECKDCAPGFQKVIDLKNAGLVIYRHTTHIEDVDTKTGNVEHAVDTTEDVYILHNTTDKDVSSADYWPEIEQNTIKCPRCMKIKEKARRLLKKGPTINGYDIKGICDHCKLKAASCDTCQKTVKSFVPSKLERAEVGKERVKQWLGKIKLLLDETSKDKKLAHSDIHANQLCRNLKNPVREPDIEQLFGPNKIDSDSTIPLLTDKKKATHFPQLEKLESPILIKRVGMPSFANEVNISETMLHTQPEKVKHSSIKYTTQPNNREVLPELDRLAAIDQIFEDAILLTGSKQKATTNYKGTVKIKNGDTIQGQRDRIDFRPTVTQQSSKTAKNATENKYMTHDKQATRDVHEIPVKLPDDNGQWSNGANLNQNAHYYTQIKDSKIQDGRQRKYDSTETLVTKIKDITVNNLKANSIIFPRVTSDRKHLMKNQSSSELIEQAYKRLAKAKESVVKEHKKVKPSISSKNLKVQELAENTQKGDQKATLEAEADDKKAALIAEKNTKIAEKESEQVLKAEKAALKAESDAKKAALIGEKNAKIAEKESQKALKPEADAKKAALKAESDAKKAALIGEKNAKIAEKESQKALKAEADAKKAALKAESDAKKAALIREKNAKIAEKESQKALKAEADAKKAALKAESDAKKAALIREKNAEKESQKALKAEADAKKAAFKAESDAKKAAPIREKNAKIAEIETQKALKAESDAKKAALKAEAGVKKAASKGETDAKKEPLIAKKNTKLTEKDSQQAKVDSQQARDDAQKATIKAEADTQKAEKLAQKETSDSKIKTLVAIEKARKNEKLLERQNKMKKGGFDNLKETMKKEHYDKNMMKKMKLSTKSKNKTKKSLADKRSKTDNKMALDDFISKLVKLKQLAHEGRSHHISPDLRITQNYVDVHCEQHTHIKNELCLLCANSDIALEYASLCPDNKITQELDGGDIIVGHQILKFRPHRAKIDDDSEAKDTEEHQYNIAVAQLIHINTSRKRPQDTSYIDPLNGKAELVLWTAPTPPPTTQVGSGLWRYSLSDRKFIDNGWTQLPTEKVVRKMNVYRMRPARPEFDWFEHNKNKRLMEYDTGEKLAEFDDKGRGRWFYKNGRMALVYYDAEEQHAGQRFVIYSNGEPDERGRSRPYTVLATFDYLGNGIVFDHSGKIRLKYNQTEGVVLDRSIGPVSHWKWHTLNDPPVLQQVMIDTQIAHKDPEILKMGKDGEGKRRRDDEEMLAIEFDNIVKEKSKKLTQTFRPFQIRMKALKINENFSLRVLDQATVYLLYRDGTTNLKLNIGMVLDNKEIVDTDTADVGDVSNNLEKLPARTNSLAGLQKSIAIAHQYDRMRTDREHKLHHVVPHSSADKLVAGISRPIPRQLITTVPSDSPMITAADHCKCNRKPIPINLYYDTRFY